MTDSAVPTQGVTTPPPTRITREGGGYVVSCACLWIKYAADETHAAKYRREHEKTCAKCKAVAE